MYLFPNTMPSKLPDLAPWQQAVEDWYTDSKAGMKRSLEDRDYRMPEEDRQNVLRQRSQEQKDEEARAWQEAIDRVVAAQDDTMGTDQNPQKTASQEQVGGDHYLKMAVQPWDVIDNGPIVQAIGYYRWTAVAYLMRAGTKDPLLQDLKKAKHVLSKLIELIEGDGTES